MAKRLILRRYSQALSLGLIAVAFIFLACEDHESTPHNWTTVFEASQGKETATYDEVIEYYKQLAETFDQIKLYEMDTTDSGHPLHVAIYHPTASASIKKGQPANIPVILINNGIHPGESDGIDASMMLLRDWAINPEQAPEQFAVAFIPVYNIGGALNRNSHSRTNQNGPVAYGFRGNANNYDLNRDFIKADTKNAMAFSQIFQWLRPLAFVDTHVSNGADYQYVLTHLMTQHNKLSGAQGAFLQEIFTPELENALKAQSWPITPYVNVFNRSPETGFKQFIDHPRYSTGYTSLFHTMGMMVETHMLKDYKSRVEGTYTLLQTFTDLCQKYQVELERAYAEKLNLYRPLSQYPLGWRADTDDSRPIEFLGYAAEYVPSEITGQNRLKYDRQQPYTKTIPYFDTYKANDSVLIPRYYGLSRNHHRVIERLKNNQIQLIELQQDLTVDAEIYRIEDYQTRTSAYEGHYLHYNTQVSQTQEQTTLRAGDYLIPTDQFGIRYLVETLEPSAIDSFFNWNFFDTVLQQKEGFSPYVWEDLALDLLNSKPQLRSEFETLKSQDKSFAQNAYAQLDWLHKHSPHYEKAHLRYPVIRILGEVMIGED